MPTTTYACPHCRAIVQGVKVWDEKVYSDGTVAVNVAIKCTNCGVAVGGLMDGDYNLLAWWPRDPMTKDFPDVPEHIADSATEVHRCLSIGAKRAAIGLARAVVEATAKDHQIKKGNLEDKIDAMAKAGVIGADTAEAAHAVRLWGNDAAHGDLAFEEFSDEDAQEVVALMDDVLNRAYQSKAKVRRIIESREARKNGQQGGVPDVETPQGSDA